MSNEITVFTDNTPANQALKALAAAAMEGSNPFMRFTKGAWTWGMESIAVADDERWALNGSTIQVGFIAWHESQIEGEKMVTIGEGNVSSGDLPPVQAKDGWQQAAGINMKRVKPAGGPEVVWKTSSFGGRKLIMQIAQLLVAQLAEDPSKPIPIVTLGSSAYKHKEFGQVFNPEISVIEWIGNEPHADRPKLV